MPASKEASVAGEEPPAPTEALYPLERGVRLSRSLLWKVQRSYYERLGIDAWRQGTVPHYITSNPFIAEAYARIVMGFLRDWQAPGDALLQAPVRTLDASQPVYLVELGSGSGRFGFHFLKKLLRLHRRPTHREHPPKVKLVMTDFAEQNVAHFQAHSSLKPFVDEGVLDFARFDATQEDHIVLRHSGETLSKATLKNPLVVFANYFFDSIPSDAFQVHEGRLYESLVTVCSPSPEPDLLDPAFLSRVVLSYEHRPTGADYYGDPDLDGILRTYRQKLSGSSVRFPVAALSCCALLRRLSGGRLLLLSADRGYIREEALVDLDAPALALHGSLSMAVNYHAIAECFRGWGGKVLAPAYTHAQVLVTGFLLGEPPAGPIETSEAFEDAVDAFGPDDFFCLKKALEKQIGELTLQELLAFIRLSRADMQLFNRCLPALLERARAASLTEQRDVLQTIEQAWQMYYPIGEPHDVAFSLGVLLHEMGCYPEALGYFSRSLALYGPTAAAVFHMGLCYYQLNQLAAALQCAYRTLELSPEHEDAKAMRTEIWKQLRR